MTEADAQEVHARLLEASKQLNELLVRAQSGFDRDEFDTLRRGVGEALRAIYYYGLAPIHDKFPAMIPPEMKS